MPTAMGRVLPTSPPSPVSIGFISGQIVRPSEEMLARAQGGWTSLFSAAAGVSRPASREATAGQAGVEQVGVGQAAAFPFVIDPNLFLTGQVTVPTPEPGTAVTLPLD